MADVRVQIPFVVHEDVFYYQCLCQKVLELKPMVDLKDRTPLGKAGFHMSVSFYVEKGTWMVCPSCRTRFQILNIHKDGDNGMSGTFEVDVSPVSGAENEIGARLRMMMDGDDDA